MVEELKCPRCGAHYTKNVPEWLSYVKCPYCKASIPIPKQKITQPQQVVVIAPPEAKPKKTFRLQNFCEFISKKGYTADHVSGIVKMGSATLYINEDGSVEGPEPFRTRMEKWIFEYMKT
jgi:DNA-directed RNA polymerase subunit RPC12/RpoP